jgi:hypothetical protein
MNQGIKAMASTNILGLFTSPEEYQRQQDLMMQRQAAELAQLDPYQSIRFGAIRAGQQFGRGLAGILGAEDPQLRMITARQSALQGIDLNSPDSIFNAARQLADAGDQQGALMLADYGRKAQADAALVAQRTRERMSPALQAAGRIRELTVGKQDLLDKGALPDSPEIKAIDVEIASLSRGGTGKPQTFGENREAKSLELYDKPFSELTTTERKAVNDAIAKPEKTQTYGVDREAVSQEVYGKPFADLTQTEKAAVNKRVDEEKGRQAEKGSPKFVMPGQKEPIDIPKLRKTLTETLDRYKSTIDAGDSAIRLLAQAKESNNASSFNAGITELAKMSQGGGRLSNQDVELARKDPAVLSRATDMVATAVFGRPSKYTIDDILKTVKTLREVAAAKYTRELNTQKKIASKAKIDQETIDVLFEDTTLPPTAPPTDGKPAGGKVRKNWAELP